MRNVGPNRRGSKLRVRAAALLVAATALACRGTAEAPELDGLVESVLPRVEVLSGLEAKRPVRLARRDSESVRRYVESRLEEDLPPEELAGVQAAYVAFGLLPDTLELRRFLLDLYTEQVVGYYDAATDSLFVVEGVPADELTPVVVHELVHALQDQYADLDSLIASDRGNDRQTAAQSALEGHATLVMFAWLAEATTGRAVNPATLPDVARDLAPLMEAQNAQFPVFQAAPRIIRETLLFPYVGGAGFVQALWRARPEAAGSAFPAPLGELLPESTEQVLHPESRFLGGRDAPTELAFAPLTSDWRRVYENTLGELEISILLSEHLGRGMESFASGWDGDRYVVLESPAGAHVLIWYSVWDSPAAADRFAYAYRRVLDARPGRHGAVTRTEVGGKPAVRVVDAPEAVPLASVPAVEVAEATEGAR